MNIRTPMNIKTFLIELLDGKLKEEFVIDYLKHNYVKGITAEELFYTVKILRNYSIPFKNFAEKSLDTCGTGGDGKCSVNISSAVAIILSSLGYNVVKHGNHSHSSLLGSADIYKLLNIPIDLSDFYAEEFYRKYNFIFLYAPLYQPAMSKVKKIRKKIGGPTIFNLVGPLLNPANPSHQIIGVSNKKILTLYTETVKLLNDSSCIVYTSEDGFDEISPAAPTECIEIKNGRTNIFYIKPEDFFEPFPMPFIKSRDEGLNTFIDIFLAKSDELVNLVAINAALALYLLNEVELKKAFELCKNEIISGRAYEKLKSLKDYE